MGTASLIKPICVIVIACLAQRSAAQCPSASSDLTPTIRALLMLEKPATLSEAQWTKVIENSANRLDLPVVIYAEDRFDPCELPKGWWYVNYAERRPVGKELVVLDTLDGSLLDDRFQYVRVREMPRAEGAVGGK